MIASSLVVLLGSSEAATIAGKLAERHNKMTTYAVLVSDGLNVAVPTKVKIAPGFAVIAMPNQQIVEMKSTSVRFYDEIFNQVASSKPQKPLTIPDATPSVAVTHREPLSWLVDSKQRMQFFNEVKRDARWMLRANSLVLSNPKKKVHSQVYFDTSMRVTEIKLAVNGKTITDWKYQYVALKDIPGIPSTAKSVKGLVPRPVLPTSTNGQAVLLAQKVWRSMSRLENRTIVQSNDEGAFTLSLRPGGLSEKGPKGSWSLSNTTLALSPSVGTKKTVVVKSGKFVDSIRANGMDISPFAWYFLNRKLPYLDVFDQSEKVELEGQSSFGGKTMSILSIKRQTNRIRMYIDPASGDVAMISSDAVDVKGNVISSSRIKIAYQ